MSRVRPVRGGVPGEGDLAQAFEPAGSGVSTKERQIEGTLGLLLSRLRLLSFLLLFLLLFLLCNVMPNGTTGRRAHHGMMTGHVSRHGADGSSLEAAFRFSSLRSNQKCKAQ
jgi:hypothetical protein